MKKIIFVLFLYCVKYNKEEDTFLKYGSGDCFSMTTGIMCCKLYICTQTIGKNIFGEKHYLWGTESGWLCSLMQYMEMEGIRSEFQKINKKTRDH